MRKILLQFFLLIIGIIPGTSCEVLYPFAVCTPLTKNPSESVDKLLSYPEGLEMDNRIVRGFLGVLIYPPEDINFCIRASFGITLNNKHTPKFLKGWLISEKDKNKVWEIESSHFKIEKHFDNQNKLITYSLKSEYGPKEFRDSEVFYFILMFEIDNKKYYIKVKDFGGDPSPGPF